MRPSGRAVGSLSLRREVAHASWRSLAAPRRVELRGRAAGVQPAAVVQRRLRDPDLPAARLRPRDPVPAPRRWNAARGRGPQGVRRPRRPTAAARAPAEASRRPRVLPWRLPARVAARGGVGLAAAVAASRGKDDSTGSPRRSRSRARATPRSGSTSGRWWGRRRPGRTGSRTRTMRISSVRVALPTRSWRRCAGSGASTVWTSSRRGCERPRSFVFDIRRCRCASSGSNADPRFRRPQFTGDCRS